MTLDATLNAAFPDRYWEAAAEASLRALDEAECVLVPAEFLSLDARFAPLEFAWGLEAERLAWCCPKDAVDRIAPWSLAAAKDASAFAWSNEVFVLGGNFKWPRRADAASRRHLVAWFERVGRYRRGTPARASTAREAEVRGGRTVGVPTAERPRALVIGASAMGNIGDDLLADVLVALLGEVGVEAYLAGPDIDPLYVQDYDAVVVGGGGLIYASRYGANEAQNLANYLKFGPIGRHFGVPTALIGVGDQDHADGIRGAALNEAFARRALSAFDAITTRDAGTTAFVEALGATGVATGSDLLFHWTQRARQAVRPTATPPARVAMIGELYRFDVFVDALRAAEAPLPTRLRQREVDVLIMSDDDVVHAERMQQSLRRIGASGSVVDVRGLDLEALVFLFSAYAGVVTTRFHGLVMAALTGAPVTAIDVPDGKIARLLGHLDSRDMLIADEPVEAALGKLLAALDGANRRIAAEQVDALARRIDIHRNALSALVGAPTGAPTDAKRAKSRARRKRPRTAAASLSKSPHEDGGQEPLDQDLVPLCWAASSRQTSGFANLGDSLSAVIVGALSGRPVRHVDFNARRAKLVAVGSIGHAIRNGTAVVWGAGVSIRGGTLAQNVRATRYDVRALRGPISAQHYRDFGIATPDVYGDPVILLPSILTEPVEQTYELGIVPHIRDVDGYRPDAPPRADSLRYDVEAAKASGAVVINTWHEPTWEGLAAKVRLLRACKRIVSQSFHGLVIAEAYRIPVLNFRYQLGRQNGPLRIDLTEPCATDPRVFEFYQGGGRSSYEMYTQRRDERTDWEAVIRAVDELWTPFEYDASALVEAFPLPLAYDPLTAQTPSREHLEGLRF